MEYQKIVNLLDNASNQPSKYRTKNWIEINDDARRMYNTNSQIKFKTLILKPSLCGNSDAYIFVSGNIIVVGVEADATVINTDRNNNQAIFKNCASFIDCITEINSTQVDNTKDLDVMPIYNLIEYSDNYLKTFGS